MAVLYLHAVAGDYRFLIDSADVHEVLTQDSGSDSDLGDSAEWRGRTASVVHCRALFGLAPLREDEPRALVVVGRQARDALLILSVDRIAGLEKVEPGEFTPLPPVSRRTVELFDMVLIRPVDQHHLLRCRRNAWMNL